MVEVLSCFTKVRSSQFAAIGKAYMYCAEAFCNTDFTNAQNDHFCMLSAAEREETERKEPMPT